MAHSTGLANYSDLDPRRRFAIDHGLWRWCRTSWVETYVPSRSRRESFYGFM